MKKDAWDWILANESMIIEASDKVWRLAELGLVEEKSSKFLAEILEDHGFIIEMGVADMPTAFIATYGKGNPTIGFMGEYDALPGLSQKPVPYQDPIEEGAPGHGCGHNIHGVTGVMGAIATKVVLEKHGLDGTIKFFGTPAEETYSGKVFMVRAGCFDGIDAVFSHHPGRFNVAGLGSSLAMNSAKFHFYGTTAHAAATPYVGRSALDAVELMNIGVNFMREHVVQEARVHYVIEEGGLQPNVVPDYARTWYYIRAPEREQVDQIYDWVLKIAEGAALMTQTKLKIEFIEGLSNELPSKGLSKLVIANMREIGAPEYTEDEMKFATEMAKTVSKEVKIEQLRASKRPGWEQLVEDDVHIDREIHDPWDEGIVWPGSTDTGDVSWITPTMEFQTATATLEAAGHDWQWTACCGMSIGHKSLILATKVIAGSAIELFTKPDLLKKIKDEHVEKMVGRKYKCPIPKDVRPPLEIAKKRALK
ncbi:MAG: amidohydrolase [Candidatus Thorarchaeota archaeon SMTZ1-45]|nr:MAG: amidohydrolase [Candidatus Thorarchaeota archaeon SMTZ1-45]